MTHYTPYQTNQIAYSIEGKNGLPIVLLHGFCEDKKLWGEYSQFFIEGGYRVVSIDLPGFGNSSIIANVSIDEMSYAVNSVINKTFPDERFILIGHSMGGYVSLAYAENFSNDLIGLGLFHSHPFADGDTKKTNRQKSVGIIQQIGVEKFVRQLIPGLFDNSFRKANPQIVESANQMGAAQPMDGVVAAQLAMKNRLDRSEVLKELNIPVLFIVGEQDTAMAYEQSLQMVHLPKMAIVKSFKDVGHMGMFEAKEATQQAILEFAQFCESLQG